MRGRALAVFLLSCVLCTEILAQPPDSRGREFWVAFLPNFHNNRRSPVEAERYADSLYLAIVADEPSRGFIEWWDAEGQHWVEPFQIADPRVPYVFARSWWGLELMGYNDSGQLLLSGSAEGGQGERPVQQSVHIVVEDGGEVTVYAFQQAVYTSDAFLVLPVDALGTEYLVMSYPSDGRLEPSGALSTASTPSQFAIVAIEEQTEVIIRPSAPTYRYGLQEQRVRLNRGEVYLVQARITPSDLRADLTGTEIRATKPVAVFAGHQRAVVPVGESGLTSRDCLLEQLPPVTAWGNSAIVVPFPVPSSGLAPQGTHRFRVLAAQPNTTLLLNGQPVAVLQRGQVYEAALETPLVLQATGPILVAAFHKTSNAGQVANIGDPFMMLIPPVQQFLSRYRFLNVQKYTVSSGFTEPVYREQYATAVLPMEAELWLDGQRVPRALYRPLGGVDYGFVWLSITDGVHDIEARFPDGRLAPLGLYVYGYGPADSYGYIGGCSFRPLDVSPPTVVAVQGCFTLSGTVYDTAATDSRLQSVEVVRADNVNVVLDPLPEPADSVRFRAVLLDPFADGFFELRARDSAGYAQVWEFAIPGFTLRVSPTQLRVQLLRDGQRSCQRFRLFNSGAFPQELRRLEFLGRLPPQATVTLTPPDSVLLPQESREVELCFVASEAGTYVAHVVVGTPCLTMDSMAVVVITVGVDDVPPSVQRMRDSCGWEEYLVIADTVEPASGLAAVEVRQQVNCVVQVVQRELQYARVHVRVLDPWEDAWYELFVRDEAGNERWVSDTLPGFTLRLLAPADGHLELGPNSYGQIRCDTVWLHNTGHFAILLQAVPLRQQTAFSVPPGQLPLRILPGQVKGVLVCFAPLQPDFGLYRDTLVLSRQCLQLPVILSGELRPREYVGRDRCGLFIEMGQHISRPFLALPHPQPATTQVHVQFGLPGETLVQLSLWDTHGRLVRHFLRRQLPAGGYTAVLPLEDLPAGTYWLQLQTTSTVQGQPLVIVR